jgi:hypothetical protein
MRHLLPVALLLLGASVPPAEAQQIYCGSNGFNLNTGVATESYRCAPAPLTPAAGAIATDGSGTATSDGLFVFEASDDAAGTADETVFEITGLTWISPATGLRKWGQVTAKASSSSITLLEGLANPAAESGIEEWSYWRTSCYRATVDEQNLDTSATSPNNNPVLWKVLGKAGHQQWTGGDFRGTEIYVMTLRQAGITGTHGSTLVRQTFARQRIGIYLGNFGATALNWQQYVFVPSTTTYAILAAGAEYELAYKTTVADASTVSCLVVVPIK